MIVVFDFKLYGLNLFCLILNWCILQHPLLINLSYYFIKTKYVLYYFILSYITLIFILFNYNILYYQIL